VNLTDILRPQAVIELTGHTGGEVLAELCAPIAAGSGVERARLTRALVEREGLGSTGIGNGIAIPHARLSIVPGLLASFGRSQEGIDFHSIDGKPAHLFFALFAPEQGAGAYLKMLARMSLIFKSRAVRESVASAPDAAEIYRLIAGEDAMHSLLQPA